MKTYHLGVRVEQKNDKNELVAPSISYYSRSLKNQGTFNCKTKATVNDPYQNSVSA